MRNQSSNTSHTQSEQNTPHTVEQFHAVDAKVNSLRTQIKSDPDDAFDKLLKFALPAVVGMIAGKISQSLWTRGKRKVLGAKAVDDDGNDLADGIIASMIFAALSAALGSFLTTLSERGSQGIINIRHKRAAAKASRTSRK
ncbi:DUF4235 domain-containing protein [Alloscardovia omnicolens]|uniref:DUF4235 domain-containing protein n=1 Tax=Alloscardovia omnicolens TaxID=419015 RepID=UPI003A5F5523